MKAYIFLALNAVTLLQKLMLALCRHLFHRIRPAINANTALVVQTNRMSPSSSALKCLITTNEKYTMYAMPKMMDITRPITVIPKAVCQKRFLF